MRRRFFAILLVALFPFVLLGGGLQYWFFTKERTRLLDGHLEDVASSLLSSDLNLRQIENLDGISESISRWLGKETSPTLITIYNPLGQLVFRNETGRAFLGDVVLPTSVPILTASYQRNSIRLLNVRFGVRAYILQVGLMMNENAIEWKMFFGRVGAAYLVGLIFLSLGVAYFLSTILSTPLLRLTESLNQMSRNVGSGPRASGEVLRLIPTSFDEISGLLKAFSGYTEGVSKRMRLNQSATAQMAHQLKTPLTIIQNGLELLILKAKSGRSEASETQKTAESALEEAKILGGIIQSFVEWARIEDGSEKSHELHAISVEEWVKGCAERIGKMSPSRFVVSGRSKAKVFAKKEFANDILNNLLENALKYSPAGSPVYIQMSDKDLVIRDSGAGIPQEVVDRLGSPFNVGENPVVGEYANSFDWMARKTGLGLARVSSLCKLYGIGLEFFRENGTIVKLTF